MKGLVYREWILSRKLVFAMIGIGVLFGVIGCLMLISARVGNLSLLPPEQAVDTEVLSYVFSIAPGIIMIIASFGTCTVIYRDVKSKWLTFSKVFPNNVVRSIKARYIMTLSVLAAGFALAVLNAVAVRATLNKSINKYIFEALVVAVLLVVIVLAFYIPLALLLKDLNKVMLMLCVPVAIAYAAIIIIAMVRVSTISDLDLDKEWKVIEGWTKSFLSVGALVAIVLIPLMMYLSYLVSIKIYGRRER